MRDINTTFLPTLAFHSVIILYILGKYLICTSESRLRENVIPETEIVTDFTEFVSKSYSVSISLD